MANKRNRIVANAPRTSGGIPKPKVPELPTCIVFSLKYAQLGGGKFSVARGNENYQMALLERLRAVSAWSTNEFFNCHHKALRAHSIDFSDTTEPAGFPLNEQLKQVPPYQFQVSANAHGRVHGFLLGNVFYVIWFDPDHQLYD
jgi:hypothetical protein